MNFRSIYRVSLTFFCLAGMSVEAEQIYTQYETNTDTDFNHSTGYSYGGKYYNTETVHTVFPQPEDISTRDQTPWEVPSNELPNIIHNVNIESSFNSPNIHPAEPIRPVKEMITEIQPAFEPPILEAASTPTVPDTTMNNVEAAENIYRLRVGDKLNISIYGESHSSRVVSVDGKGYIHYLYIEPIYALGKTIDQLRHELTEKMKSQFKHALVSVTAESVGGEYYTILGEVTEPGQKLLTGRQTILTALGAAKGLNRGQFRGQITDFCDLDKAFISRRGEYLPVDFKRLIKYGDASHDIPLMSGDYIYIPTGIVKNIYILGEVNNPTTMAYLGTVSLVEALAEAQWITNAASSRILVLRGSLSCPTKYLIDINSIMRRCDPDFMLEPGDIVYVPPQKFLALKLILQAALRNFVCSVACVAGQDAYFSLNPGAACGIDNVPSLFNNGFFNSNGGGGFSSSGGSFSNSGGGGGSFFSQ